jgi:ABC-type branched-subunit amino acid transport system ATPase component
MSAILEAVGVGKKFGGVVALQDCNVHVDRAEVVGIIGPNGAGKTTLFNLLSGIVRPTKGKVILNGSNIDGWRVDKVARHGAVKTFQVPKEFSTLSVFQNLLVADAQFSDGSVWQAVVNVRHSHKRQSEIANRAADVVNFLNLKSVCDLPAGSLSTGQKKLLDLGRALMLSPDILLLDEPLAGVSPVLAEEITGHLKKLSSAGMSIALIEHRIEFVQDICDRVYILADGGILMEGEPKEVLNHSDVIDVFFGRKLV